MKRISIDADNKLIGDGMDFIRDRLSSIGVNKTRQRETSLICEELLFAIINDEFITRKDKTNAINIGIQRVLGSYNVIISYQGEPIDISNDDGNNYGLSILGHYEERISIKCDRGYNTIVITSDSSYNLSLKMSVYSALISIAAALPVMYAFPQLKEPCLDLCEIIINLFNTALMMIAPLITFITIVYSLSNYANSVRRFTWARKIAISIFFTAAVAIIIGMLIATLLYDTSENAASSTIIEELSAKNIHVVETIKGYIKTIVPETLIEPFTGDNTLQLLLVSVIVGIAASNSGSSNSIVQNGVEGFYALFSKVLNMIYSSTPLIIGIALFRIMMEGSEFVMPFLVAIAVVLAGFVALEVFYAGMVSYSGLKFETLLSKMKPCFKTIFLIGSVSETAPYISRQCVIRLRISQKMANYSIPFMSRLNMDGNCLIVSMLAGIILSVTHGTIMDYILLGILVGLVSTGAPAQPGSIIIASTVILKAFHLGTELLMPMIILEVMMGPLISFITSLACITMVSRQARKENEIDANFNRIKKQQQH